MLTRLPRASGFIEITKVEAIVLHHHPSIGFTPLQFHWAPSTGTQSSKAWIKWAATFQEVVLPDSSKDARLAAIGEASWKYNIDCRKSVLKLSKIQKFKENTYVNIVCEKLLQLSRIFFLHKPLDVHPCL